MNGLRRKLGTRVVKIEALLLEVVGGDDIKILW
jgi:hypothetical protein